MKKQLSFYAGLMLLLATTRLWAQPSGTFQTITQRGVFDHVFDRFGNEYPLVNLSLNAAKPVSSGTYSVSNVPTNSCIAGYFNLYFEAGSYWDANPTAASVLCEIFSNITGFINSPLAIGSNTLNRVNIYCANIPSGSPAAALASASGFYVFPYNPVNPNGGILDNQIQRALISGQNPFNNLSAAALPGAGNFYSGYVYIKPSVSWNQNMFLSSISSTDYDLYSVMLHEVMHALGFASLMGSNGVSLYGASNNYFSRYDQYLKNAGGIPLLAGPSPACSNSSLALQVSTTAITPGNCINTGVADVTTCSVATMYSSPNVTVDVYTPNCYEAGSTLSHFEDMCTVPASFSSVATCSVSPPGIYNNLYYVMSNANGSGNCYIKRRLRPEERFVLCDLGYNVNTTYTSNAAVATQTYAGTGCAGSNIWGQHDGISGSAYTFTTTGTSICVPISTLLANDATVAIQASCPEVVYGTATVSVSGSSLCVSSSTGAGLVVVKYLPNSGVSLGSPTYVFFYFIGSGCLPTSCDMVANGDFESSAYCGGIVSNCWETAAGTPDLFKRNCTVLGGIYNLGNNVFTLNPVVDSHNGSPNDVIVGMVCASPGYGSIAELLKTNLTAQLIPGQAYQLSAWLYNPAPASTPYLTVPNIPLVVSISADVSMANIIPTNNYPGPLPVLADFTVQPQVWTQFTNTFVFNPANPVNHNVLVLGLNSIKTSAFMSGSYNTYCFFDDVSLIPVSGTTPTFVIPQAANCGNTSLSNLGQYTNYPGTFTGSMVTSSGSGTATTYNFNSPPSLPAGTYPIAFNYTLNGCAYSLSQNVVIQPTFALSASTSTNVYCANYSLSPVTFSASSSQTSGVTYNWLPVNLSGQTVTLTPVSSQVYTLNAYYNCLETATLSVAGFSYCCTSTVTPLTPSVLSTYSLTGPLAINADITVPSGQTLYFASGEFQIAPNVKITVSNGAALSIKDSHLYACGSSLWQGIVVQDGGGAIITNETKDNLIEDAITAVDVSNHTTSTLSNILTIERTTFNKNYIDINIDNYQRSSSTYPFSIKSCVFSSRSFTFTQSSWPQTATTSGGLRSATNPTTGLAPPYALQSATITNLKSPYSSRPANIAIKLNNVGITSGSSYYGISINAGSAASEFNLFDAHSQFIAAQNSNVGNYNAVFQNTRRVATTGPFGFTTYSGGEAIQHNVTSVMNARLDLTAANVSQGNRFWNCHTGVAGNNTYRFNIEYGIFRSTQSYTALPGSVAGYAVPGTYGINISSNRVAHYMRYNEFSNVNTGIADNIALGTFTAGTSGTVQTGIYAANLAVVQNTFSPLGPNATSTVIGTNYMNQALSITSPSSYTWTVGPDPGNTGVTGLVVQDNFVERVFDGILLNGIYGGWTSAVTNNTVSLEDDNVYVTAQRGISSENTSGNNIISGNYLSGAGTGTANTLATLVYCGINTGVYSPSVTCNTLDNSYQGFDFDSYNNSTVWAGNVMQPLTRGLVLENNGVMGTQGSNGTACNNQWSGTWNSFVNFGTYIGGSSMAQSSPLWVKTGSTFPPNPSGSVGPLQQYGASSTIFTSTGGDYNCIGLPNNITVPIPQSTGYSSDEAYYIAETALYRLLWQNDSVLNSDPSYSAFYSSFSGSSIDLFLQAEQALYENNLSTALSLCSSITPTNSVEQNYKDLYTLYATYVDNGDSLNSTDSTSLFNLTVLCPGESGACIYQARALYRGMYNLVTRYGDNCHGSAERLNSKINVNKLSDIQVYPNPTNNRINIKGNIENDILNITIKDLSGRLMLEQNVKLAGLIANLDLSLLNGAYLITIINGNHDSVTKKLLITK